jgi:hypothetical protein
MTTKQALSILKKYNKWRRGDGRIKMPDTKQIGIAIDIVVQMIEFKEEMAKWSYIEEFKNRPM